MAENCWNSGGSTSSDPLASIVPRSFERRRKGPGDEATHPHTTPRTGCGEWFTPQHKNEHLGVYMHSKN